MRLGPLHFRLREVLGGGRKRVKRNRHQLGDVARSGRGVETKQARIGIRPVEGVDGIGKPALFAHLLEEP